jgi:uncharacterized membrane protein (UPF0127 family)
MRMTECARLSALVAVLALVVAPNAAPAQAQATPAACVTAQTAGAVPVRVRAPAETLELRVADTISKREYGLMCVRSLPPHTGMIFVFGDGDNPRDFWMKNTLIPLDMVFVSKNGLVNEVSANVPATKVTTPDDKIPHRDGTGTYVIELAAGEAARAGIKPGTTLDVSGIAIPMREE